MADLTMHVEEIRDLPKSAVASFNGEIDGETIITFQNHLASLKNGDRKRLVIEMGGIRYINSTGFGCLINFADTLSGEVVLVRVQQKVRVVLDMLGLNSYFKIFPTKEDAVRYLRNEPAQGGAGDSTVVFTKKESKDLVSAAARSAPSVKPPVAIKEPTPSPAAAPVATPAPRPNGNGKAGNTVECRQCRAMLTVADIGAYKCPRCLAVFSYIGRGVANFLPKRKINPIQLGIATTNECAAGFAEFVRQTASVTGFRNNVVEQMCQSVREMVGAIRKHAYGDKDDGRVNILIIPSDKEIEIQCSDYGKDILAGGRKREEVLPRTLEAFDKLELKTHPRGGNLITIAKKC